MKRKNKVVIISGPTATGKTSTSIDLARKFNGEIINFDSLLFYKELNIGTAKPTLEEMGEVPHHLVGTHSIQEPINAADFYDVALDLINKLHESNKTVFLVGGSGFYLQAILNGMYDSPTTDPGIIEKSDKLYTEEGIIPFIEILKLNDIPSYERYHENDHYRIRRAVEHYWNTNTPFSQTREKMQEKLKDSPVEKYSWDVLHIYLDIPKDLHFEIIQKRTQKMYDDGLIEEIKSLLNSGANGNEKPLKSIGYKESIAYLNGEFDSIEEYLERISINTRRLAKSQRTWFKKQDKLCYNTLTDKSQIEEEVKNFLSE